MYYTSYSADVDGVDVLVAEGKIGLATSYDGLSFSRISDAPLVLPDSEFDMDELLSLTIVEHQGVFYMVYTGWSLDLYRYGLSYLVFTSDLAQNESPIDEKSRRRACFFTAAGHLMRLCESKKTNT